MSDDGDYDYDDGGYSGGDDTVEYENDVGPNYTNEQSSYVEEEEYTNEGDVAYDSQGNEYEVEYEDYTNDGYVDGGYVNDGFVVGGYDDVYVDSYAPGYGYGGIDGYGYDYYSSYSPGIDFIVIGGGCYGNEYIGDEVVYVERDGRVSGNIATPYNSRRNGRNWPSWPINVNCKACSYTGPTNTRKLEMQKWPKIFLFLAICLVWSGVGLILFIYLFIDDDNYNWGHKCANCNKKIGRGTDY